MNTSKRRKRINVGSDVRAAHVYPEHGSPKSADALLVDIVLESDEALKLAQYLVQAARESHELTIAAARKPAVKSGLHPVTVTYAVRKIKRLHS